MSECYVRAGWDLVSDQSGKYEGEHGETVLVRSQGRRQRAWGKLALSTHENDRVEEEK